jgi:hypothetical protein
MKTQLAGVALFAATVSAIALYPAVQSRAGATAIQSIAHTAPPAVVAPRGTPRIDVVFALDTTSSMSGFIAAAKEKIWSIATTMASAQPAPEIRIGLVAFRDRGDAYVTRVIDLSADLDSVYAQLMDFQAQGGGDGPESVNQALYDAVHRVSWSSGDDTYKVIFLVGDAPPHMDYPNDVPYPTTIAAAAQRGIRVNTIQSGADATTARAWQAIAALNQGEFLNVAAGGDAVAVTTPFDDQIATLSRELDETRLFFGDGDDKARQRRKQAAADKVHAFASSASRARRAAFNASASGAGNFLGEKELVDAVVSGKLDLDRIPEAELPATLQALPQEERHGVIAARAEKREQLKARIADLAGARDAYIAAEVEADGGAAASLDHKLYATVKEQAAAAGLSYDAAPKY